MRMWAIEFTQFPSQFICISWREKKGVSENCLKDINFRFFWERERKKKERKKKRVIIGRLRNRIKHNAPEIRNKRKPEWLRNRIKRNALKIAEKEKNLKSFKVVCSESKEEVKRKKSQPLKTLLFFNINQIKFPLTFFIGECEIKF